MLDNQCGPLVSFFSIAGLKAMEGPPPVKKASRSCPALKIKTGGHSSDSSPNE